MDLLTAIRQVLGFTGPAGAGPLGKIESLAAYDPQGKKAVPIAIVARGVIGPDGVPLDLSGGGGGGGSVGADLTAIEALTGTGFAKRTDTNTWALAFPTIGEISGLQTAIDAKATPAQIATAVSSISADALTDGTTKKAFLATERTKLSGIASGATANATDANLRDRAFHTGSQPAATISDFNDAVTLQVGSLVPTFEETSPLVSGFAHWSTTTNLVSFLTASATLDILKTAGLQTLLDAKATPADISTAIAALVASSPSTLDTLNELATALGNDPSFATTVSTSIGLKLAKASNLSDLANASTARTNLGVAIGSDVQAYSSVLTTWAGKTVPTGTVVGISDTQTLTNKRVTKRIQTLTDSTTVTPTSDDYDAGKLLSTQNFTLANPTGTPTAMQPYLLRITSSAARTITWGTQYRATSGQALPTATTGSNSVDFASCVWNADDSKWDVTTSF